MSPVRTTHILFVMILWVSIAVLAVAWGTTFDWPDYVHVDYGLPFVWATHTLVTIAGPADKWNVNVAALIMDLALWLGSMVIVTAALLYLRDRKSSRNITE